MTPERNLARRKVWSALIAVVAVLVAYAFGRVAAAVMVGILAWQQLHEARTGRLRTREQPREAPVSDEPQVILTISARDDRPLRAWPPLMDWIREHDADPNEVVKLEIAVLDGPFVRFTEAKRDADGHLVAEPAPDGGKHLATTTRDVLLRRMPPERAFP